MAVFYRKYRPQKLADLIGQEHVKETLLASLSSGKISHGYLFTGPKGSGKTSTARILAKAVNCEAKRLTTNAKSRKGKNVSRSALSVKQVFGEPCNKCDACLAITEGSYLDLIEIDAASNRGIDEIRDLREKIKLSAVAGRFKVYIIDEVHMLTTEAFNALLKTLEEPPAHAIFILCTTAPEKIPATVASRLSRFNFRKATSEDIFRAIEKIAKSEGIKIEKEAMAAIAKIADGSFRDALSILDQLASLSRIISEKDVKNAFKLTSSKALYDLISKIFAGDLAASILALEEIGADLDVANFIRDAIYLLKGLLFIKIGIEPPDTDTRDLKELAQKASYSQIQNLMKLFLIAEGETRYLPAPEIALTLAICKFLPEPSFAPRAELRKGKAEEKSAPGSPRQFDESSNASAPPSAKGGLGVRSPSETLVKTLSHAETPRAQKKETVKVSKATAKSLAEVEARWGEFLAKVRPVNAHVVALLRSARPSAFDGANLEVEVFFKFHKEKLEEPKIMDLLCGILEEILGKPVSLKMVLASRGSAGTKTVTLSDVAEVGDDELSKMAAEIFSK